MNHEPTVTVTAVPNHHALVLRWAAWINEFDVPAAFHEMTAALDRASLPLHVIVDLTQNPNLPLATTISETVSGPFMHPMMGQWLVVGSNRRAEIVARTVTAIGLRTNINWFDDMAEAMAFLETLEAREAAQRIPSFEGID